MATPQPDSGRARQVPSLLLAAVLTGTEALALLGVGVSVVVGSDSHRLLLDVTTTMFFLVYGGGLLACARGLLHRRRWARAPVILAQLIQILVAWSFYPGATRLLALVLVVTAVVVLGAVLSPASTRALVGDDGY